MNKESTKMNTFNISNRRYLGNKYKLLEWIKKIVDENCTDVNSFFDVFSGTGSVASAFCPARGMSSEQPVRDRQSSTEQTASRIARIGMMPPDSILQNILSQHPEKCKKPGNFSLSRSIRQSARILQVEQSKIAEYAELVDKYPRTVNTSLTEGPF